uniref:tumor necrosis factor receptor superfamily member 14-like n=1 Tax=Solea senegalensis TaxID=28829 RepID=UPI001CD8BD77|nr:tumor necrosis factor receptor superfamily member 14-like [Solea senegalensis]
MKSSGLKTVSPCTRTRDALCEPLEGFYCIKSKGLYCDAAEKHRQCKPGQYIRDNGTALTDTVCTDCSAGTFSDGTFTTCRPHTHSINDADGIVMDFIVIVITLCAGRGAALLCTS